MELGGDRDHQNSETAYQTSPTQVSDSDSDHNRSEREVRKKLVKTKKVLKEKDEENKLLHGKIRGYQTLGHLYAEVKEQCRSYKKEVQELQEKLEFSNQSHTHIKLEEDNNGVGDEQVHLQEHKEEGADAEDVHLSGEYELPPDDVEKQKAMMQLTFTTLQSTDLDQLRRAQEAGLDDWSLTDTQDVCLEPGRALMEDGQGSLVLRTTEEGSVHDSSTEEKWYKSLDAEASRRRMSGNSAGSSALPNSSSDFSYIIKGGQGEPMKDGEDSTTLLSLSVKKISTQLSRNDDQNSSKLVGELAQIIQQVDRLERENKRHRMAYDVVSQENETLRRHNTELLQRVRHLERERDGMSPTPSMHENSLFSKDWITVQQNDMGEMKMTHKRELEMQGKIKRLQGRIQEIQEDSEQKILRLKQQLSELQQHDEKRQRDIDTMLLTAKKRSEDQEMGMEKLHQDMHELRQRLHGAEAESQSERQRADQAATRAETLEAEIRLMRDNVMLRTSSMTGSATPTSPDTFGSLAYAQPDELRTQVQVLRQQAVVYKDDFDRERTDREQAKAQMESLKIEVDRLKNELFHAKDQIRQRELDVVRFRTQAQQLRDDLSQKMGQMRRQQEQLGELHTQLRSQQAAQYRAAQRRPQSVHYMPGRTTTHEAPLPSTQPSARTTGYNLGLGPASPSSWSCNQCTFENPPERSSCEICGTPRFLTYHTFEQKGYHNKHGNVLSRGLEQCDTGRPSRPRSYPQYGISNRPDDIVIDTHHSAEP